MTDPSRSVLDSAGPSTESVASTRAGQRSRCQPVPASLIPASCKIPQHQVCGVPGHVDDLVLRLAVPAWPDDGLRRDLLGEAGRTGAAVGRVDGDGGQVGHR
jgi:hypothetical protein